MGFLKHKPKQTANLATRKGVHRDYVEEAQRNPRIDYQATDNNTKFTQGSETGGLQDRTQTYMAQIRSEAVHARKLAEQIDNMSKNVPTQIRKQVVMTDSTIIDSGKIGKKQRRASDKPRAAKVRSSFNPLHPSMELPPEQLIRLLGLESKKIRKHKRTQAAPGQETTAPPGATTLPQELKRSDATKAIKETPTARPTHRQREHEHARKQGKSKNRHGLWLPALTIGLICGVAGSIYLFWMQPEHGATTKATAPVASKVNRSQASSTPHKPAIKTPASTAKPAPAKKNDPAWLATVEARKKHLQDEAETRFEKRLKQAVQEPSIVTAPVAAPQPEVVTTDRPETLTAEEHTLVTTGESDVITTGEPVAPTETAIQDGTLGEGTGNSTASQVTEPVDSTPRTPVTPDIGDSSTIESIE